MRLAAQAKGGFYPTPDRVVDMIADLIGTPIRILLPQPGDPPRPRPLLWGRGRRGPAGKAAPRCQRHPSGDLRRRASPGQG